LARAIRRSRRRVKGQQPAAGSFLFLGPTGVGKTEVASRASRVPVRKRKESGAVRHVRVHGEALDFETHRFASGIRGLRRGGQLTERVKRNPYSIILLDEIEKAHPDVYNILLQVFEDGS